MGGLKATFVSVVLAMASAWGSERITVDKVENHYPWDGKVDCVTTVSGLDRSSPYKCVFTLTVEKGGETVRRAVTNALVTGRATYTNTFNCTTLFGEGLYPNGGIAVELVRISDRTGDPIGIVGDVLVIDISDGSEAESYSTEELADVDLGTFNCDVYKTDKIVLRKVPAGTYYCQPGANYSTVVTQRLTTAGFYIGVFPVTQRQYERVMGENPSYFSAEKVGAAAQCPVERIAWSTIRGDVSAGTKITTASRADSFLKRLVKRTGFSGFDLPTEAQWEIASRADSPEVYGAYWNGTSAITLTASSLGYAAWYSDNAGSTTHPVGGKKPNPWGLYDTIGNVWEWCRDDYSLEYDAANVDTPYGKAEKGKLFRGGRCVGSAEYCYLSCREKDGANETSPYRGFRLMKDCR